MQLQSLGWEDPLEQEMETHFSILAQKIPWTEEPCELQPIRSQSVQASIGYWSCKGLVELKETRKNTSLESADVV